METFLQFIDALFEVQKYSFLILKRIHKIDYFLDIEVNHVIPPARTTQEYIIRMGKRKRYSYKYKRKD